MRKFKKYLYLLQLEEYQTDRYLSWLDQYSIDLLAEEKGKLEWTPRILLILALSYPLSLLLGLKQATGLANNLLSIIFRLIENVIVLLTRIKLSLHPSLTKIVVTGSYGKTTFKEMLAAVLETKYSLLKTEGNINTRTGIAQTILKSLHRNHQVLLVEAGTYKKGEIKKICELVQPAIGIITIIGWMHLERFGTIDNIRQAKFELADFIKDKGGLYAPKSDHEFIDFPKVIAQIGKTMGISESLIQKRLKDFGSPEHRLSTKTINKYLTVIDDAYNSNPLGFERALKELKKYKDYQKIVVTPGMIELGEMQFSLNQEIAQKATRIVDIMAIVGEINKEALSAIKPVKKNFKLVFLGKNDRIEESLSPYLRPPSVILLENELPDHYF